jgi:hypothetical protein
VGQPSHIQSPCQLPDRNPKNLAGARRFAAGRPSLNGQPAYKPGSGWHAGGPACVTAIHLERRLPGASSNLPGRRPWTPPETFAQAPRPRAVPIRSCSRWGLPCRRRCRQRGALLPHLFTLAAVYATRRGGLFSVALSLSSRSPDVIRHRLSMEPGLSSPATFRFSLERPSDRLTPQAWWRTAAPSRCQPREIAGAGGQRPHPAAPNEQVFQRRPR